MMLLMAKLKMISCIVVFVGGSTASFSNAMASLDKILFKQTPNTSPATTSTCGGGAADDWLNANEFVAQCNIFAPSQVHVNEQCWNFADSRDRNFLIAKECLPKGSLAHSLLQFVFVSVTQSSGFSGDFPSLLESLSYSSSSASTWWTTLQIFAQLWKSLIVKWPSSSRRDSMDVCINGSISSSSDVGLNF